MRTWGIVVAAGSGSRFGGPKHVLELDGRPLWVWARDALLEGGVDEVTVVGPVPGGVAGGTRRQDSVAAGLAEVPAGIEVIAVHDAARPLASSGLVGRLLEALDAGDAHGVVPAVPVSDTIKVVDADRIVSTLDRHSLVAVQTPQVFRAEWLRRAHGSAAGDATDDAAMVEAIGGTVITVPGEPAALKITYPGDVRAAVQHLEVGMLQEPGRSS